jgi:hypothetical protein
LIGRGNFLLKLIGGLDTSQTPSSEIISKKSSRTSTQDKSLRDFTVIYKKKFDSSEETKVMGLSVHQAMITKNKDMSKLPVLQNIEILQRQIDTAEDRPNFDRLSPSDRWIFYTESLVILVAEYKKLTSDPAPMLVESSITPLAR